MSVQMRRYIPDDDFGMVSDFLIDSYRENNSDGNCLQPIWEYSYTHPGTNRDLLDRVGLWIDDERLCGVAFFETEICDVFFCRAEGYESIASDMFEYAESAFITGDDGEDQLRLFARDTDTHANRELERRGYVRDQNQDRTMSRFVLPEPFDRPVVPNGYALQSLDADNDLAKMHRVLHRGFNHGGEPDPEDLPGRRSMQSGPNFRADLTTVCTDSDGRFVSYCGIWFVEQNGYAYVEPVAVDPDHRKQKIGTATVLEGIRKASLAGAQVAYVWTDMAFYQSFGFKPLFTDLCWTKRL